MKALLSKNKKSVFYPKKRNQPYRTLSWRDALLRGEAYFPATIPRLPVRRNLEFLGIYRDNAVHFYNANDFGLVLYALTQTSIINFRDLLLDAFRIRLEEEISLQLLPIGIRPPIDIVSYISGKPSTKMTTPVRQFLTALAKGTEEIKDAGEDTGRLLTVFDVKLESIKKIGEADVVVAVEKGTKHDGPLAIVRTQDPNKSHPLRQKEVLKRIGTLHGKSFTSHTLLAKPSSGNITSRNDRNTAGELRKAF